MVCHRGRVVALPSQKRYVTVVNLYDTLSEVVRHRGKVVGIALSEVVCHHGKVVGLPSLNWYVTVVKS